MEVVEVGAGDGERVKGLRLAALGGDPEGFGSTWAREEARPAGFWEGWARESAEGREQKTYVLVSGGAWVGLAMVRVWPEAPGEAELLSMYVAPEARGRGGAELLCDACANWTRARGVPRVVLACYAHNARARRAYEKCGFSVGGGEDGELLRMERRV